MTLEPKQTPAEALALLKQICDSVSTNWETHTKIRAAFNLARDCILKQLKEDAVGNSEL